MCDQSEYLSVIQGHRIYKDILHPPLERHSVLQSQRELVNDYGNFAVAVMAIELLASLLVVTIPLKRWL